MLLDRKLLSGQTLEISRTLPVNPRWQGRFGYEYDQTYPKHESRPPDARRRQIRRFQNPIGPYLHVSGEPQGTSDSWPDSWPDAPSTYCPAHRSVGQKAMAQGFEPHKLSHTRSISRPRYANARQTGGRRHAFGPRNGRRHPCSTLVAFLFVSSTLVRRRPRIDHPVRDSNENRFARAFK